MTQNKLLRREYASLSEVESDCKRLVVNAKTYNDRKTLAFDDAERVRKTASNFMVKHNPAYKAGGYSAQPTPLPDEATSAGSYMQAATRPSADAVPASTARFTAACPVSLSLSPPRRRSQSGRGAQTLPPHRWPPPQLPRRLRRRKWMHPGMLFSKPKTASSASSSTTLTPEYESRARLSHALTLSRTELQIFVPFINLPNRSLRDYYQLIKRPTSLSGIQKKIRGVVGRGRPTNVTEFKTWAAFEEEVSFIWRNACEYNEDESDMFNLANEFEVCQPQSHVICH